ncbi:ATP-binding protein [Rhizobacter sp. SG703]|uniref:ATP-binding protein n=1 Tax=Rhizobacter sp. SG703 TaxID=2587140 RepID=UPI001445D50D|nr:ATP-binding protein [Rhizobacter sp. SG703]NKI95173.1 two-component system osmolarity sensor histidine kinase EnvZ [Rhizobacter sp. SG703]
MRRFDSLFARLLLAQLGLVAALALVFGLLFYIERNVTVATLYAERWASPLAAAAGLAPPVPDSLAVQQRDEAPPDTRRTARSAPRFVALRQALLARGVPVDEVRLGPGRGEPMVWLHVVPADRPARWLGVAGQVVVPAGSARTLLALLITSALVVGVSWRFTRRLTRPLEQLRERMQSHRPGQPVSSTQRMAASPEIAAIDAAYGDLLARLQQHERERAVLLAGVSHDLRSPLGRIRLAVELLPDTDETRARRAGIVRNVRDADRLIESFLDHVRAGELACDETVDLAAVARQVVAGFERPAAELAIDAPATLPRAHANRLLVERLLANLVDNALKHGRAPVRVGVGGSPAQAWITVDDAGDGIPAGDAARLTDAFARGDGSRARPGAGLGLAIVRQVATRLGGELSFERVDGLHRVRVTLG